MAPTLRLRKDVKEAQKIQAVRKVGKKQNIQAGKKVGKKQKNQAGKKLQAPGASKKNDSSSDRMGSGDPSDVPAAVHEPLVQISHAGKASSVLIEPTPISQRGRMFHKKNLYDVFSKLQIRSFTEITEPTVDKQVMQHEILPASASKENESVSHSVPCGHDGHASVERTNETRAEHGVGIDQEEAIETVQENASLPPTYPGKQQQRTMDFFLHPNPTLNPRKEVKKAHKNKAEGEVSKKQTIQAGKIEKKQIIEGQKKAGKKLQAAGTSEKNGDSSGRVASGGPSNVTTVVQKPVVQTSHVVKSSAVLTESTSVNQRGRNFHIKKLSEVFSKFKSFIEIPESAVNEQGTQHEILPAATSKENVSASHGVPSGHDGHASGERTTETRTEHSLGMEQEETIKAVQENVPLSPTYRRKQQQRTMDFCFYPIDAKQWAKEKQSMSVPHKRVTKKRPKALETDEETEVLLWKCPSKKRTLRDLTDVEVAFTIFKQTMKEFGEGISDRNLVRWLKKYEDLVEEGIIKKLRAIEEAKTVQEKVNKLKKSNKALSLQLGSLIDRKIKLQYERTKVPPPTDKTVSL